MIRMHAWCRLISRLVSDRLDGSTSGLKSRLIDRHLAKCPACREQAAFFAELKQTAANAPFSRPPEYIWERISLRLDEHPWGEDRGGLKITAGADQKGMGILWTNMAGALAGIALAFLLGLHSKGGSADDFSQTALAEANSSQSTENIGLYMTAHPSQFPMEVRRHYVRWMTGVDRRITRIKTALDHHPGNMLIQAQLAAAYENKVALYRQMSREYGFRQEPSEGQEHATIIERSGDYD